MLITERPRRRLIGSLLIYSLSSWLVLVALGLALGCLWRFWRPLGFLRAALGPLGDPMGSLRGPLGLPRGSLGGPLRVPWGALKCTGRFSQICRNLDAQFRANVSICTRLRIEYSLPEILPRIPRIPRIQRKRHLDCSSLPPCLAPGARMT